MIALASPQLLSVAPGDVLELVRPSWAWPRLRVGRCVLIVATDGDEVAYELLDALGVVAGQTGAEAFEAESWRRIGSRALFDGPLAWGKLPALESHPERR